MRAQGNFVNNMLTAWLRKDDNVRKDPTWTSLCEALRACGHGGIADKIGKALARAGEDLCDILYIIIIILTEENQVMS